MDRPALYLRQVYENRDEVAERAKYARPAIREKLSLEAAGRRIVDRQRQITATKETIR
jgi:hypothetical protein